MRITSAGARFLIGSIVASAVAHAQVPTTPPPIPAPCHADTLYRKFDFWVGNWRVTTKAGVEAGTSRVEIVSGGCALLENWRSTRGVEGKSLNTYDPATRMWRQFWVGQQRDVTDYRESEWKGSSLTFVSRSPGRNGGPELTMRLTFSPLDEKTVRQLGELSSDGGNTFTTQYDLLYHRIP
jgi:hypothetical protein